MASDLMKPPPVPQKTWDRLSDANKQLVCRGWIEELLDTACVTETIQ